MRLIATFLALLTIAACGDIEPDAQAPTAAIGDALSPAPPPLDSRTWGGTTWVRTICPWVDETSTFASTVWRDAFGTEHIVTNSAPQLNCSIPTGLRLVNVLNQLPSPTPAARLGNENVWLGPNGIGSTGTCTWAGTQFTVPEGSLRAFPGAFPYAWVQWSPFNDPTGQSPCQHYFSSGLQ